MGKDGARRPVRLEKERTLAIDKEIFAHRLWQAIKRSGLTYRETARLAQAHLPAGLRLSDVSVWSYAKGRSLPRRMAQVEALARVLGLSLEELVETVGPSGAPSLRESGFAIEDLGGGRARLRVAMEVSWERALQVADLLRAASTQAGPAPGP